jgi:hypothetical protein
MDFEQTPTLMHVTCRTDGCLVADVTYALNMYANTAPPVWNAVCAQCGQAVTDVVPA